VADDKKARVILVCETLLKKRCKRGPKEEESGGRERRFVKRKLYKRGKGD